MTRIRLAFDRSMRHTDREGRLHVSMSAISKSNVRPYFGAEVPHADVFGLDPSRIYQLHCAPDELAKAVPTANNLPLLDAHIGVSARDPQKDHVVGSTGTDAIFEAPYLKNSLVIWDADAIRKIEDGTRRELSCSYSYVPVMEPGTYLGERYDGTMHDIHFNHLALVEDGRAGSDVLVSDAMPIGMQTGVHMFKDKLQKELLGMGISSSDLKRIMQMYEDEHEDMTDDDLDLANDPQFQNRPGAGEPRGEDRALLAQDMSTTDSYRKMRAFTTAQAMVRPLVGEIMAADAAQVIKTAIRKLGYGDVLSSAPPREALPALWKIVVARHRGVSPTHAMDAKGTAAFNKQFPNVARVQGTGLANFGVPSRIDNFGQRRR